MPVLMKEGKNQELPDLANLHYMRISVHSYHYDKRAAIAIGQLAKAILAVNQNPLNRSFQHNENSQLAKLSL